MSAGAEIRTLTELGAAGEPDALARFCRVDELAFGAHNDAAYVEAKRRIVDPDRFFLAVDDRGGGGSSSDVGCAGNFGFEFTLPGGATVPVSGVGDVGVVPTHRRRGILRSMIDRLLQESADRGEVASLLTASEATIYGRFGYGVAERRRVLEIPVADAALRPEVPVAEGELRLHLVAEDRDELSTLLGRVHAQRAGTGSLSRSPQWWSVVLGDAATYVGGGAGQRVLVHRSASALDDRALDGRALDGRALDDRKVDGYAIFTPQERWGAHGSGGWLEVREVVGASPAVELALWRALFEIDLVTAVHVMLPEHHLLDDALVDRRALRCTALRDHLWLRPIDIAGLLSARTYLADGAITLFVTDPVVPEWGGRFRLEAVDGKAECRRLGDAVDDAADGGIGLGTAELGSVVLGGGSFRALARSGRVHGSSDDLAVADAMFDADPPPWTDTKF